MSNYYTRIISINQQDKDVAAYLKSISVKYEVRSIGVGIMKENDWECDAWHITFIRPQKTINKKMQAGAVETFEFFTGIGHRTVFETGWPKRGENLAAIKVLRELIDYTDKLPQTKSLMRNPNKNSFRFEAYARAIPPTQAAVLYGILLDAESARCSTFNEWCSELGYDEDSRKAEKIYFTCQEESEQLDRLFNREQQEELRQLLEDY